MVLGQYPGNVGSGNRVSFPKKFRQTLGESLILTKGLDGNIIIVAVTDTERLTEGIDTRPYAEAKARELQAFILGNAFEIELDRLGRFVIPEHLRRHAGIGREVVFIGIETYVQLWDLRRFDEHQKRIHETIDLEDKELPGKE